eukprot:scaffold3683_cov229-Prasinococcus_capsulatus_cf.AAC.1
MLRSAARSAASVRSERGAATAAPPPPPPAAAAAAASDDDAAAMPRRGALPVRHSIAMHRQALSCHAGVALQGVARRGVGGTICTTMCDAVHACVYIIA